MEKYFGGFSTGHHRFFLPLLLSKIMTDDFRKIKLCYYIDEESPVQHSGLVIEYVEDDNRTTILEFYFRPEGVVETRSHTQLRASFIAYINVNDIEVLKYVIITSETIYGPCFVCWDWTKIAFHRLFDVFFKDDVFSRLGAECRLEIEINKHKKLIQDNLSLGAFNILHQH